MLLSVLASSCATPTTVLEIPSCADRVEVSGQASRTSKTRFELDHSFDLPLMTAEISFQAGKKVETVRLVDNTPDPLRFFFGAGATVLGAVLLGAASYEVGNGASVLADRPFYEGIGGTALVGVGVTALLTGWHPQQRYVSFPDACAEDAEAGPRVYER